MKIKTILATKGSKVITIRADATLKEAVDILAKNNIGAMVVVDEGGKPVGILSERDIVREAARNEQAFAQTAWAVMTKVVIAGSPHDDLKSVLKTMTEKHFRHLPIIDRGQLVGIVSIGDMVKAQIDEYEGEIETLQTQLTEG